MTVLLIALAAFMITEVLKVASPWILTSWAKVALLVAVLAPLVWLSVDEDHLLVGAGAAGGAALLHRLHRLLGALGDKAQMDVIMRVNPKNLR